MPTRRTTSTEVIEETPTDDLSVTGVRPLEVIPEEPVQEGVDEIEQAPPQLSTTQTFFGGASGVSEIVEVEPEIVEGDEPTYRIRLTQDVEPIYIGIDYLLPAMRKDVLYEVNERVYQYFLPKGLIQGK
jgi:murein tripeptide amidase MpaA